MINSDFSLLYNLDNLLLVAHAKPDGDTLGANCALALHLESLGKKLYIFCQDTPATYFDYLPNIKNVVSDISFFNELKIGAIVILDHGSLKQSGVEAKIQELAQKNECPVFNIDHHISNDKFGKINIVEPSCCSTCELVFDLLDQAKANINNDIATCLMTGIITDTSNFTNSATTQKSLETASKLSQLGVKLPHISEKVFKNKSIPSLNLWGEAFLRLQIDHERSMAYTILTNDDLNEKSLSAEALDGLVNFLCGLQEVKLIMFLNDDRQGKVKGSLRSVADDVDCTKLAALYGGGGHIKASGFMINGSTVCENGVWKIITPTNDKLEAAKLFDQISI
jgi:phosphoesterase RecJ-like protein